MAEGLPTGDNAPWHKHKMVLECFEEHNFKSLKLYRSQSQGSLAAKEGPNEYQTGEPSVHGRVSTQLRALMRDSGFWMTTP